MVEPVSYLTHDHLLLHLDRRVSGDGSGGGGDVDYLLCHWALIARTAEPRDGLFIAPGYGWRTRLLQADDVPTEAEAEVTGVIAGDLLCRDIDLAVEHTSAGWEGTGGGHIWVRRTGCDGSGVWV